MKGIEELKQNGNLLKKLLNPQEKIYLLRVYGYESHVGNVYYRGDKEYMEKSDIEEEKKLLEVFQQIRKKIDEERWNDFKNRLVEDSRESVDIIYQGYDNKKKKWLNEIINYNTDILYVLQCKRCIG